MAFLSLFVFVIYASIIFLLLQLFYIFYHLHISNIKFQILHHIHLIILDNHLHLINTNHHHLVLRYLQNNVNDGATDKQIIKVSEWYDWIATTQEKYKNKYTTVFIYEQTVSALKYIAVEKRKENK